MKLFSKNIILFLLFLISYNAFAQSTERNWQINGYVKDLRTFLIEDLDNISIDNLFHHRLNFKWYVNEQFTLVLENRNRIFYGESVKTIPNYAGLVEDVNNDIWDLSVLWLDKKSVLGHSMIDRGYVDFVKGNFEARLGRQRINWGINTVWNPHDLFNTFSFFDFDYEERPGSDALRLTYYTGVASSVEAVTKLTTDLDKLVTAALWKVNKWNYDFQFLGGLYQKNIVTGIGWAGSIKETGFKGELSYFYPYESADTTDVFAATLSADYSINNWFLNGSVLYNSAGQTDVSVISLLLLEVSPKRLSPYKYSVLTQALYQFSPLVNGGLAAIYSPGQSHALFLNPSLGISLKENWTLDALAQLFFNKNPLTNKYEAFAKAFFVRLKWSY